MQKDVIRKRSSPLTFRPSYSEIVLLNSLIERWGCKNMAGVIHLLIRKAGYIDDLYQKLRTEEKEKIAKWKLMGY
jgi:hypothetical protein